MDPLIQEIQFLDLSNVEDETVRNHLHQVLYASSPSVELPWEGPSEFLCTTTEYGPTPYAVAPIPHPSMRGVFLPQPLYTTAPAAVAVGLVTAAEPPNGPASVGLVTPMDAMECDSGGMDSTSPASTQATHHHIAGEAVYQENTPPVPVMSVPPPVPTSVPPPAQSVMTSMYQVMGPTPMMSNVYVGNVTANVNVQGYVGTSLSPYSHIPQQQMYSPTEVPVPQESSPNAARNNSATRRARNQKPSSKRGEGNQYISPRNAGAHGHEMLTAPPVVDSPPTGAPPIQQNYLIPVPAMHPHPFQQPFYPSAPQHHGTPHIQHMSAQHAAGPPIYLQGALYQPHPASLYNPYPQPPTAPPIMYSNNQTLAGAPVPSTESSTAVANYQVEEGPSDRMIQEVKEVAETDLHSVQHVPYSSDATSEVPHHTQTPTNSDAKSASYPQDSDVDNCNLVTTVVVNNSTLIASTPHFPSDTYQSSLVNTNSAVMHQSSTFQEVRSEPKFIASEVPSPEVLSDDTTAKLTDRVYTVNTNTSDKVSADVKRESPAALPTQNVGSQSEKLQCAEVKLIPKCESASSPLVKSALVSSPFSNTGQKSLPSANTTFQRLTSGPNMLGTSANELPIVPAAVMPSPMEKSWASLFDKSAEDNSSLTSSSPTDAGVILAAGTTVNSVTKPVATVPPFQNATPVVPGTSDNLRKGQENTGTLSKNFPPLGHGQLPVQSLADDPYLYRLGEFLSKYQLDHKAISLQPRGLTNRSNWCYVNSTLQALLACPPFYNLLKSLPVPARRTGKSSTPIIDSMIQFVNEFVPLCATSRVNRKEKAQRKDENIEVQTGAAFEPNYIYRMLSNIQSDTFKVEGRQEDAEEFFTCLLNSLNDEMLELIKLVEDPSSKTTLSNGDITNGDTAIQSQDEDETEWRVIGQRNKSSNIQRVEFGRTPVSDIFRGQLRSRVQRAGYPSTDCVQPFFTLQLNIEKAQSVKDALELLVGRDQLEGVTCSRTNQEVEAWQQVTLEELPLVLVLHLKWFDYKLDGCSKIVKTVEFPIDLKMDGKLMSSSNKKSHPKQKQYKLFAVVYHDGKEATKGHYITDVYHVGYGGWVRYDDSVVKAVQETNMLHPRGSRVPYLLYYRRCDTIGSGAVTPDKNR